MPLIVYNLTTAPLVLAAGNPVPTLKASTSAGTRGQGSDVTTELLGLTSANYTALQAQQTAGFVQYEWTDLPEYGTFSLVASSAQQNIVNVDLNFYADATLGNNNNPGTQALPVQTLAKLISLIPIGGYAKSCQLHMAPGTYLWNDPNSPGIHGINKLAGVGASPPVIVGAYSPVAGPFTVTAVNADSSLEVGGAFVADQYFGVPRMRIVSGPGAGVTGMCAGNTTTALLPSAPLNGPPGSGANVGVGSVIILETPSVFVNLAARFVVAWAAIGMIGVKLTTITPENPAIGAALDIADSGTIFVESCIVDLSSGVGQLNLRAAFSKLQSANPAPWGGMGAANPFSPFRTPGAYILGRAATAVTVRMGGSGELFGSFLFKDAGIIADSNARIGIGGSTNGGCHTRNTSFAVADVSSARLAGASATARALMVGSHPGFSWIVGCFDNSIIERLNFAEMVGAVGNAVQVGVDAANANGDLWSRGGARANIGDVSSVLGTVTPYVPAAVANTGVGVKYTKGSYVVIDAVAGVPATAVTGTSGDTEGRVAGAPGAGDNQTYATVRTADANGVKGWPTLASPTTSIYMNRIEPAA